MHIRIVFLLLFVFTIALGVCIWQYISIKPSSDPEKMKKKSLYKYLIGTFGFILILLVFLLVRKYRNGNTLDTLDTLDTLHQQSDDAVANHLTISIWSDASDRAQRIDLPVLSRPIDLYSYLRMPGHRGRYVVQYQEERGDEWRILNEQDPTFLISIPASEWRYHRMEVTEWSDVTLFSVLFSDTLTVDQAREILSKMNEYQWSIFVDYVFDENTFEPVIDSIDLVSFENWFKLKSNIIGLLRKVSTSVLMLSQPVREMIAQEYPEDFPMMIRSALLLSAWNSEPKFFNIFHEYRTYLSPKMIDHLYTDLVQMVRPRFYQYLQNNKS